MLVAEHLSVHYGPVRALFDVTVEVRPGQLAVLLGANGAGKTTTLRALSGLVPPSTGRVVLDDDDVTGAGAEDLAARGVAHIVEGRGTFARLTVEQNLVVGLYPARRRRIDRADAVERALDRFPALRDRLPQRAGSLSGGEQQMLALARALVAEPRYLLVDEPSHGLAPKIVADVFDLLAGLRNGGLGVLVVEQHTHEALALADHAYVLERGRLTYAGIPGVLVEERFRLIDSYLGSTQRER